MAKIFIRDEDGCGTVAQQDAIRQQQIAGIFGFTQAIAQLNQAWIDPQTQVFLLDGATGSGKTALLKKWLHHLQQKHWHDAEAVYVWTFYPPDLAHPTQDPVSEFFHHALHWFGGKEAAACPTILQAETLARLIQAHHTLLVLDGVEILQTRTGSAAGKLADPRIAKLLSYLSTYNTGLCVVVGREPLVADWVSLPCVQRLTLDKLDIDDCISLLRHKGVEAEPARLQQIAADYGQNPLTLTLLAGYLATWHGGDWRRMDKIPVLMDAQADGRQARRILVANSAELAGQPAESLLYLLSMLYRPTHWDTIAALMGKRRWLASLFPRKPQDSFKGLIGLFANQSQQKQYQAILRLRELGLLELSGRCFWLPQWVREAWQRQLRYDWPQAWKESNQRLMLFHANLPKDLGLPETPPLIDSKPASSKAGKPFAGVASVLPTPTEVMEVTPARLAAPQQIENTPTPSEVITTLANVEPLIAEAEQVAPAIASNNVVPFPSKRTYSAADAEALDGLSAQLRQYQNTLQMLQMRTKKLQKQLRDFDQAVQAVKRPQAKSG